MALTKIGTDSIKDDAVTGGKLSNNVDIPDNNKIRFGTSQDLQIFHSGTDSFIQNYSGDLNIRGVDGKWIVIQAKPNEQSIICKEDGAVEIYHDGTKQCETSANGLAFPSGKGIDFSAQTATSVSGTSTSAEVLDHYEEGTFTAYLANVSAPTYEAQGGRYTRIGRMVFCDCTIGVSSGLDNSDGSAFQVAGLPFTGSAGGGDTCLFSLGRYTNLLGDKQDNVENIRYTGGGGVILMEGNNDEIAYNEVNSSGYLQISLAFMIA
tara:strand:- start:524 stop:1315 length:792 start_codon:yes stop_codon:yes gene_type:complete